MDNEIIIGLLVGLTFATSVYIWNSEKFNRIQKIILLFFVVFPPIQWLGILLILLFNSFVSFNSSSDVGIRGANNSIENLRYLKNKGILTEKEFELKVEKIEFEKIELKVKKSSEYKSLKSLLDSGFISKDEFEIKLKLLKNIQNYDSKKNNIDYDNIKPKKTKSLVDNLENKNFKIKIKDLFSFEGRITRGQFFKTTFKWILFFFIIMGSIIQLSFLYVDENYYYFRITLATLIWGLNLWILWAQGTKRCHDLGKNGWWQFIPLYILWMLFKNGQYNKNKYGNPIR
jgi:uncharacterized membrane protein YhaH (DUF805 family)